jgi:tetratricopeptide (TPR) repeat protein
LNPNSARTRNGFAVNLMFRGCFEEAIRQIDLALELDPLSLLIHANAGAIRYCARRYDEAEKIYKVTLELEPNFGVARLFLGCLYLQEGRHPEAISELRRASNLTGGTPWAIGCLGIAYAHSGEPDKARVLLEQLEKATKGQYISPVGSALIHLGLGETEKFREWAEDALQYRDVTMPHLKVFPEFDTVRSEPWFTDVLRQMKLVDELVG